MIAADLRGGLRPSDVLRTVESTVARLIHDLVNPAGAIANGVELFRDLPEDARGEALQLIDDATTLTVRRLEFMRAALGTEDPAAERCRQLTIGFFGAGKLRFVWDTAMTEAAGRVGRVVPLACLVVADIIGHHGSLKGYADADGALVLEGEGRPMLHAPGIAEALHAGLAGQPLPDETPPKALPGYLLGLMASARGTAARLSVASAGQNPAARLVLTLPARLGSTQLGA